MTHFIPQKSTLTPALKNLLQSVKYVFEEKILLHKILGFRIESLQPKEAKLSFDMQNEAIGHFTRGMLHGGAIATALDAVGGLVVIINILNSKENLELEQLVDFIAEAATIDIRVDYLRPGQGKHFIATSELVKIGQKVAVTRMELYNNEGMLIAIGTGSYNVS
jgi:uncharacterized protein (TIGR00369 family)